MSEIIVDVKNLTKQYGKQLALDNVSFRIKKGSIVGLIGPNGAGKTTIMKIMAGLAFPTGGELEMYGATDEKGLNHARTRMSFMIETPYEQERMTARENLEKQRLQKGIPDKKRIDEVLEIVNLQDTGKKIVKNFSLGMRQRLGLANALMARPEFMVLDEPINGLDPKGIKKIRHLLKRLSRENSTTILISSHILSEIENLADIIGVMDNGQLITELTKDELNSQLNKSVIFEVSDPNKSEMMLESIGLHKGRDYKTKKPDTIYLYSNMDLRDRINEIFVKNGIKVKGIIPCEENLEEYFTRIINPETELAA